MVTCRELGDQIMSSSIGSTGFSSLTPDQLDAALVKELAARVPDGSTATFHYGANSQNRSSSPTDIISFSPEANAALNRDQIALQVISRGLSQESAQPQIPATSTSKSATNDPATNASSENGTPLLDQYQQLSVTDRFYATANVDRLASSLSPDQQAGFLAAYKSGTLNIQNASDVPLLNDKETWTISKTMGGGMAGSGSFSSSVNQQYGQQYLVMGTAFGGDMFVSWGSPISGNNAAAVETPTVANASAPTG
jgi:hypothetical protein